jgi:ribosomal protein L11 methyltransferase
MDNTLELSYHCKPEFAEIILAELAQIGFDYFMDGEDEGSYLAYGDEANFRPEALQELSADYPMASLSYTWKSIPKENWNKEWESHYDPIEVAKDIYIRAHFHPAQSGFKHEIVITPKMSFGTGHHATTHQMLSLQLGIDHQGKSVLDVGTGTGILAIMAGKLGATEIVATDIDDWSIENSVENAQMNGFDGIQFHKGTLSELDLNLQVDILLANINTHVLLEEMPLYARLLKPGGHLLLSGFYTPDAEAILAEALALQVYPITQTEREKWAALHLQKAKA